MPDVQMILEEALKQVGCKTTEELLKKFSAQKALNAKALNAKALNAKVLNAVQEQQERDQILEAMHKEHVQAQHATVPSPSPSFGHKKSLDEEEWLKAKERLSAEIKNNQPNSVVAMGKEPNGKGFDLIPPATGKGEKDILKDIQEAYQAATGEKLPDDQIQTFKDAASLEQSDLSEEQKNDLRPKVPVIVIKVPDEHFGKFKEQMQQKSYTFNPVNPNPEQTNAPRPSPYK